MAVSGQNIFWFFDTGVDRWKFHTLSPSLSHICVLRDKLPESLWKMYSGSFCYCPIRHWTFTTYFLISALTTKNLDSVCYRPKFADFLNNCLGFNPKTPSSSNSSSSQKVLWQPSCYNKTSSSSFAIAASINSEKLKNSPSHLSSSMCLFLLAECSVCSDVFALRTWALGDQLDLHPVQPAPSCGHFPLDVLIDTSIFFLKFLNNFTDATKCIDNEHQQCRAVYAKIRV